MQRNRPLTPRQTSFVTGVLSGLSDHAAAQRAGYGVEYARKAGTKIRRAPLVKQAIEREQSQLRQKAKYDVEQAVVEIDRAITFGYAKSNPMSVAKLLELKMRLYGLWVDRIQIESVDLKGALIEAETRVLTILNPVLHRHGSDPALLTRTAQSLDKDQSLTNEQIGGIGK